MFNEELEKKKYDKKLSGLDGMMKKSFMAALFMIDEGDVEQAMKPILFMLLELSYENKLLKEDIENLRKANEATVNMLLDKQ